MNLRVWFTQYRTTFSYVGLVFATLFFAASLSPSLLPRNHIVQGLLSGIELAVGYGVGWLFVGLWTYLELPVPSGRAKSSGQWLVTIFATVTAGISLWRATVWQNSIRTLMEMEPLQSAYPLRVLLIAIILGGLLVAATRFFWKSCSYIARKNNRIFPRRISNALGFVIATALVILLVNGVLAKSALSLADTIFSRIDAQTDEGIEQPTSELASGSETSLIPWHTIGRQGKDFIASGPTKEQLSKFSGEPAQQPLRVYVGLRSGETTQERAKLALKELIRVGGFSRSVLVVATPTGTGWLDPGATDTLEYLHAGDTAIVSMQYSYLPSWITILVDPNKSRVAARALFEEVYQHWKKLPRSSRPKLYLHGLSLGSLGSETSADLLNTFEDPIQGTLWSGPPFPSRVWSRLTRARQPSSPAWLPVFRDGRVVRFMGQHTAIDTPNQPWSSMRCLYVQHASDPMVFFSPSLLYQKPKWLDGERGPDVSPYLDWYPIITFLQIACDLPMATSVPTGYGHNYAPANYIEAWIAVTEPTGWSEEEVLRLKQAFAN
ncbi:alpha/beta hydrolase [Adhaeretor mobilis]|uniref:Alpha/beta-hydrolase family protein n=1 Tax=Adhaeretor mobilis TaxID=1930276 RepID=A0A517N0E4_9BACT|nr:alpha/beta-hydrolase family protein [Adhaeretor mobilis]QDT00597.1 hypothetical protein HG15A2_39360 [Adhaeretor mobilis]